MDTMLVVGGLLTGMGIYQLVKPFIKVERDAKHEIEFHVKLSNMRQWDRKLEAMKSRAFTIALFNAKCNQIQQTIKQMKAEGI